MKYTSIYNEWKYVFVLRFFSIQQFLRTSILILKLNTKMNRVFNFNVTYFFFKYIIFFIRVFFSIGYNLTIITQFQTPV